MDATIEALCPMDITLTGDPERPDGVYRRLTPEMLGWMRERLEAAARKNIPADEFKAAHGFYDHLVAISGMMPVPPPATYTGPKLCTICTDWP